MPPPRFVTSSSMRTARCDGPRAARRSCILHLGGARSARRRAERFVLALELLSDAARSRLVIENDDRVFALGDVLRAARPYRACRVVWDIFCTTTAFDSGRHPRPRGTRACTGHLASGRRAERSTTRRPRQPSRSAARRRCRRVDEDAVLLAAACPCRHGRPDRFAALPAHTADRTYASTSCSRRRPRTLPCCAYGSNLHEPPTAPLVISRCIDFDSCRYNGQVIRASLREELEPHVELRPDLPGARDRPRRAARSRAARAVGRRARMVQPSDRPRPDRARWSSFSRDFLAGARRRGRLHPQEPLALVRDAQREASSTPTPTAPGTTAAPGCSRRGCWSGFRTRPSRTRGG